MYYHNNFATHSWLPYVSFSLPISGYIYWPRAVKSGPSPRASPQSPSFSPHFFLAHCFGPLLGPIAWASPYCLHGWMSLQTGELIPRFGYLVIFSRVVHCVSVVQSYSHDFLESLSWLLHLAICFVCHWPITSQKKSRGGWLICYC